MLSLKDHYLDRFINDARQNASLPESNLDVVIRLRFTGVIRPPAALVVDRFRVADQITMLRAEQSVLGFPFVGGRGLQRKPLTIRRARSSHRCASQGGDGNGHKRQRVLNGGLLDGCDQISPLMNATCASVVMDWLKGASPVSGNCALKDAATCLSLAGVSAWILPRDSMILS